MTTVADIARLSEAQREVLGQIAMGGLPAYYPKTLAALERKGLIQSKEFAMPGKGNSPIDRIPMKVKAWRVTSIAVHMAWCAWCAENVPLPEDES